MIQRDLSHFFETLSFADDGFFGVKGLGGVLNAFPIARLKRSSAPGSSSILGNFCVVFFPMTDQSKLIEEHKAIRESIVDITLAWSHLENTLALILARVIDPEGPGSYAFAIFYSVASADAKIDIVDGALTTLVETSPHEKIIQPLWEKALKRVSNVKRVRNAVAHGQITSSLIGGKNYVRLTPPIYDWRRMHPPMLKGQPPGLSHHDLSQTAKRISKITTILDQFFPIIEAISWRNAPEHALLEKLQQLATDLTSDQDQKADRTPPKP